MAGTGFDARTLQAQLLEQAGVATIAGTSFGEFGEGYLRFSYANSREAIGEAIERIRDFLGNLPTQLNAWPMAKNSGRIPGSPE